MRAMVVFPTNRFRTLPAALVVAAATLLIGCNDKPSKPHEDPVKPGYLLPTSAHNVVLNLQRSWERLDYDGYTPVLSDQFTYVFAPQDVGGPANTPDTWGLADELLSANHLFSKSAPNADGYVADSVSLSFQIGPEIPNDMENWTKIVLSQIFLTVSTHHKTTGDPLWYLVQGDQAYLWFAQAGGTWKIVRWEDRPIGVGHAVQPSTWGQIKGLFR